MVPGLSVGADLASGTDEETEDLSENEEQDCSSRIIGKVSSRPKQ